MLGSHAGDGSTLANGDARANEGVGAGGDTPLAVLLRGVSRLVGRAQQAVVVHAGLPSDDAEASPYCKRATHVVEPQWIESRAQSIGYLAASG